VAATWRCHQPPETGDLYFKGRAFACAIYRRRGADAAVWITYPDEQAHYAPARWVWLILRRSRE
jgi:hypothetical protein